MMRATAARDGTWLSQCSPAFQLLMATSWLAPDSMRALQDEAIREACTSGVNWDEYVRLVERHRTSALSWTALKHVASIKIPVETARTLKRRSDACRIHAAIHLQLLTELLKAFNAAGIPAMPLKGPLLSLELYGDAGLRESKDLDVLVSQSDIPAARQCLIEIGWHCRTDDSHLSPRQADFRARHEHHVSFVHHRRHCELELHWRTFWENEDHPSPRMTSSIRREMYGCFYQAMNAVDLAIDLCEHGSSHAWFRVKWLGDIARVLAGGHVEVEAVLDRARESGQDGPFLQCLKLLQDAYDLPVPDLVEREVLGRDPFVVQWAVQKLTNPSDSSGVFSLKAILDRLRDARYVRRLWPRKSRWAIFEEVALCPDDFELIQLPDRLFWLYIPLRPFLWAWRCRMRKAK